MTTDVEAQRQALPPQAERKPMLHKLIDAVLRTGNSVDDLALLLAAASIEQMILDGPRGLYDEEPIMIARKSSGSQSLQGFTEVAVGVGVRQNPSQLVQGSCTANSRLASAVKCCHSRCPALAGHTVQEGLCG